jgi:MOSC domain-containing protein YiiM
MDAGPAKVVSVNVGAPETVEHRGRVVLTAIWKRPVSGRVAVRGVNLAGDDQADRSVHGGADKAVYAYAREDYEWWAGELGAEALEAGTFGENLTVSGLDLNAAKVGERWRVGSALLEVSEPRFPCFKLGIRMGDPKFLKRFAAARRPGLYLRIAEEGELGAGDDIEVVDRPRHAVTIGLFAEAYLGDRGRLVDLLAADALSASWRAWILERTGSRAVR